MKAYVCDGKVFLANDIQIYIWKNGKGFPIEVEEDYRKKTLKSRKKDNIILAGGALDPESDRADKHAKRFYEGIRKRHDDCRKIAKNTGYPEDVIAEIKNFVFMEKHQLSDGLKNFAPSYDMAQSWQRLIDGTNIQEHDITLLKHEIMERNLMRERGIPQDEAHELTNKVYNYGKEVKAYNDKIKRNKKRRRKN